LRLADRGHALSSLHPPPAALASLPNSTMPAYRPFILAWRAGVVNVGFREGCDWHFDGFLEQILFLSTKGAENHWNFCAFVLDIPLWGG
jgi:hypothetical protein